MEISDQKTSVDQMKNWVQKFCEDRAWDAFHGPKDLAIGLVTEGSELLEIFRFVNEKTSAELVRDPAHKEKIADELADSLYFILRFAQMYDFDLSRALSEKLEKNIARYPALKSPSVT